MRSAIIFDLDGTITRPCLDFDAIRREMGLPPGRPILEEMDTLSPRQRAEALAVLDRHEERAARESTLHDGASETIAELHSQGHAVAVLTRNVRKWTRFVLEKHGIEVDAIRCRDDGIIKPSPLPVLELCRELGAAPGQSWVIGDHRFDIESGRQAGTRTILLLSRPESRNCANLADYAVRSLPEIVPIVLSLNT
ncbi:MAG: HAD family hydrolase [Phycisphaerales bacterium]|nr:MAG: HAD family hydrolase [Phycisphaerales bacterium]